MAARNSASERFDHQRLADHLKNSFGLTASDQYAVGFSGGADSTGRAARKIALEDMPIFHAATMIVNQLLDCCSGRGQNNTRFFHVAGNGGGTQGLHTV